METKLLILLAVSLSYLRITSGVRLQNPCPANKPEVGCKALCSLSSCSYYPNAMCYEDHCGQCKARWFDGRTEVTEKCNRAKANMECINGEVKQKTCENPCHTAVCNVHNAECVFDACGGCYDRWYNGTEEITNYCKGKLAMECENKHTRVYCRREPCQPNESSCPGVPAAQCRADRCKSCYDRWFVGSIEVTDKCSNPNKCLSINQCLNGGVCVSLPETYQCLCKSGYSGPQCENPDRCINNPCINGGRCVNAGQSYQCQCVAGYGGTHCETPVPIPETCVNGEIRGKCNVDPCKTATCKMPNTVCVSDYCGGCYDRWYVGTMETSIMCKHKKNGICENGKTYEYCAVDPCSTVTCNVPGAICRTDACGGCFARWFVNSLEVTENCQYPNQCTPTSCQNGGICVNEMTSFKCVCPDGYTGANCQSPDYCVNNQCLNGASCVSKLNTYECVCSAGYMDTYCGTPDHCATNPCLNGGTCLNDLNSYRCSCPIDFTGPECQTSTATPEYLKCRYGRLVNGNVNITCSPMDPKSCPAGFFCSGGPADQPGPCCLDERQNLCGTDQPLRTDGDVEACWGVGGKQCIAGHVCKYSLDPQRRVSACCPVKKQAYPLASCVNNQHRVQCTRDPCDGATCANVVNAVCIPDYCGACHERWYDGTQEVTGQCKNTVTTVCVNKLTRAYCEIDPCTTAICSGVPGATCRSDQCGGCMARWYAGRLEVTDKCKNNNRCLPNACKNGGTCVSLPSSYMCHCATGYSGPFCETNYRCQPNTCLNGGSCVNLDLSYRCNCMAGFSGKHCETNLLPPEHEICQYGKLLSAGQPLQCMPAISQGCPVGYFCKGGANIMTSQCCLQPEHNVCGTEQPYRVNGEALTCGATSNTDCPANHTCTTSTGLQHPISVCCPTLTTIPAPVQYSASTSTCVNGKIKEQCATDPCQNAACSMPHTECVSDMCGCHDRWYISSFEVTGHCKFHDAGKCANNLVQQYCPSQCATPCTGVPEAVCRHDACGGCFDRYFVRSVEVTDKCTNPNSCQTNPCLNGGVCVSLETTHKCMCFDNYVGPTCAEKNFCGSIQCQNGGTCVNLATSGQCNCLPGFNGDTCQFTDACATNPCVNGGTCVNNGNTYTCTCMPSYTGLTCDAPIPIPEYKKCRYGAQLNGSISLECEPMASECGRNFFCSTRATYNFGTCCLEPEHNICGADEPYRILGDAKTCTGPNGIRCPATHICKSSADPSRPVSVCCPTKPPVFPKHSRLDCRYGTYYPDIITSPSCKKTAFSCPSDFKCRGGSNSRYRGNCCLRRNPCLKHRPYGESGNAFHCMGVGAYQCPDRYECVGSPDQSSACCLMTARKDCRQRRRPDQKCQVNLCKTQFCPNLPKARCLMEVCGKCEARWYHQGNDVTDKCPNGCPADKPTKPCPINPCSTATCLKHPTATCSYHNCGADACKAKFFLDLKEVAC